MMSKAKKIIFWTLKSKTYRCCNVYFSLLHLILHKPFWAQQKQTHSPELQKTTCYRFFLLTFKVDFFFPPDSWRVSNFEESTQLLYARYRSESRFTYFILWPMHTAGATSKHCKLFLLQSSHTEAGPEYIDYTRRTVTESCLSPL